MGEIITRCGYRCDMCMAYRPNAEADPSGLQVLSDGWFKYFGFRVSPENMVCDGCMSESPRLIDDGCPVRPCVISRAISNCSECEDYGCERLLERTVVFEEIESKHGSAIPELDRERFIAPDENKVRLDALRAPRQA